MTVVSSAMQLRGDNLSTEQIHEKRWLIHSVMSLGLVLVVMSVISVNVALPTLVSRFSEIIQTIPGSSMQLSIAAV